jgi:tetratricopeptide (TPR) repeat protein
VTHALLASCAAWALLASPPTLAADDVAEARARFDQGAKLFHAARYREAIAAFEAAYRLKPHGAIHFNVAQCKEKLGEWPAALRSYQDYLRELPDARDRAAVRAAMGRIEERLAAAGVQALLVYTDPPGAALGLDGKPRGRTPFQITLPPGTYRLALRLDGFAPEELEVEVGAAASRLVELVLRPSAGTATASATPTSIPTTAPPSPSPSPSPAPAPSGPSMSSGVPVTAARPGPDLSPAPPPPPLLPATPRPPPEHRRRLYTWVAAGAAVAAGATGAYYGLAARRSQSTLRDGAVHANADALARDAKQKASTANVCYGLSGVAAAAGVTLFFVEGRF